MNTNKNTILSKLTGAACLCALLLTAGCSGMSQRDANTVGGAAVGGVAGALLTGGSGIGTVGGAAVGGVIGNQVHR